MKKIFAVIVLLAVVMATLCECDTGHKVTVRDVVYEENGQPCYKEKVREYETNAKGEVIKDSGWMTIEYEEEKALEKRQTLLDSF